MERDDPDRHAGGLDPDRCHGGSSGGVDQQLGVAAGQTAERSELIAHDQDLLGGHAALPQMLEVPAGGVGLVGEADLDVLGVARHTRVREPGLGGRGLAQLDRRLHAVQPMLA